MAAIMIETPIAFGLTMIVCLVLFCYCWRIRKLRNGLTSVQVSATPMELQSTQQAGIQKEVIATFPTVKANELKVDVKEELQCPVCLVEYGDTEVLRKLPLCGHIFHIRCVDPWLENQVTCPVCRVVLTAAPKAAGDGNRQRQRSTTSYWRVSSVPGTSTVEVARGSPVPAWVLVNRPMPLPPAMAEPPSSPDVERPPLDNLVESPLLDRHAAQGWGAVYLERSLGGLSFRAQSKECVDHSSISERWMTESFFFGISSCDGGSSSFDSHDTGKHSRKPSYASWKSDSSKHHASWSSRSVHSSWDFNQPATFSWQTHFEDSADEVLESRVYPHRPLTMSPERCSFEFLPIITGPGGDHSFTPLQSGHSYSHL